MKQEFTRLDDGRVKWSYEKEEVAFEDKEFGNVGVQQNQGYIMFESYEKALVVLDRDLDEAEKMAQTHKQEMDKNEHSLEKFPEIKALVEAIGKLHNDFKEVKAMPEHVNGANERKYNQTLKEFNKAKDYIVEGMSAFNREYGKYLAYGPAKKAYDFTKEQLDKITDQRKQLIALE